MYVCVCVCCMAFITSASLYRWDDVPNTSFYCQIVWCFTMHKRWHGRRERYRISRPRHQRWQTNSIQRQNKSPKSRLDVHMLQFSLDPLHFITILSFIDSIPVFYEERWERELQWDLNDYRNRRSIVCDVVGRSFCNLVFGFLLECNRYSME